jgi:penicillin G amidase
MLDRVVVSGLRLATGRCGSWRSLLGGVILIAFALAAASPASAAVIRATSILPPGESGFVSVKGLATGTGSPHLYDQQQAFIEFKRKDAMFNQRGTAEYPMAGVKIVRDAYGVPSITGKTTYDVWWGAGWATAQDRLAQLELYSLSTTGTAAAQLGPSYLPMDIEIRRDFYTTAELTKMFHELPAAMRERYRAYDAGINAWADRVRHDPSDLPAEFAALGLKPPHFSIDDLLAIGVYLTRTTPNSDGSELQNMQAIQKSGPANFNTILPLRIKGQVSTIPASDGLFPSVPGRTHEQETAALARSYRYVRHLPIPDPGNLGYQYVSGTMPKLSRSSVARAADDGANLINPMSPIRRGGSYMVAISDPKTHHSYFFNGPELGFSAPEELYEMELHGPGLEVRGVTAPGAPVIAIGTTPTSRSG